MEKEYDDSQSARISVARIAAVLSSTGFASVLLWLYENYTTVRYAYVGYDFYPNTFNVAVGLFLVFALASVLPLSVDKPGTVFLWILFVLVFIPVQMISPVSLERGDYQILGLQLMLMVGFVILLIANTIPSLHLRMGFGEWKHYAIFVAFVSAGSYLLLLSTFGIPSSIPTFAQVYDVRLEHREELASTNPIISYVWAWAGSVINPLTIAFGVINRKSILIFAGTLGQVYLYSLNGGKSTILSFLLILALVTAIRKIPRRFGVAIALGAFVLIPMSRFLDYLLSTEWFTALFGQRLVVVPGILTGYYYDFFMDRPKGQWAYSFLSPIFDYPYDRTPAFLIGSFYYGNDAQRANANFWADGYANAGFFGTLIVSVLAGLVLWTFNSISVGRSVLVLSVLAGFAAYNLAGASLSGSLLTHGIALSMMAAVLMPYKPESAPDHQVRGDFDAELPQYREEQEPGLEQGVVAPAKQAQTGFHLRGRTASKGSE